MISEIQAPIVELHWIALQSKFEKEYPDFISRLLDTALEDLTPTNIRNAICIRLHLSIKDTAKLLNVSQYTIPKARNRLKKKLGLGQEDKLYLFLLQL